MSKLGIEVEVKPKHIKEGNNMEESCPIALALKEKLHLNDDDTVQVNDERIFIAKSNGVEFEITWTQLPSKVKNFIESFDEEYDNGEPNRKVKPFTFIIPLA